MGIETILIVLGLVVVLAIIGGAKKAGRKNGGTPPGSDRPDSH